MKINNRIYVFSICFFFIFVSIASLVLLLFMYYNSPAEFPAGLRSFWNISRVSILLSVVCVLGLLIGVGGLILKIIQARSKAKAYFSNDPDEQIRILKEALEKGEYKDNLASYYSNLSVAHHDKEEYEKALELTYLAESYVKEDEKGTSPQHIQKTAQIYYVIMINRAISLLDLGQIQESLKILDGLNGRIKNKYVLAHLKYARARLAVSCNDIQTLKRCLDEIKKLVSKTKYNSLDYLLLLQAEYDVMAGDILSANFKLDKIFDKCTYLPTLRRAEALRDSVSIYR